MIGLQFREQLPPIVAAELDALLVRLQRELENVTSTIGSVETLTELQARVDALQASISALSSNAEVTAHKDQASGYAGLTAGSKLKLAELTGVAASSDLTNDAALEKVANKAAASGYASLDANVRVVQRIAPTSTTNSTTGSQNNYNFASADVILMTNATGATLTGAVPAFTGQIVIIMSGGAGTVTLSHLSGSSTGTNQWKNKTGADVVLVAGTGTASYRYSGTQWVQLW